MLKKGNNRFLVTQARMIFFLIFFFFLFPINFIVIVLDNNYLLSWAETGFLEIPPT